MKDYAAYLPLNVASGIWQVALTAAGFTNIPPGAPYPLGRHPLDHLFTWQRGRVLSSYQIIYISGGKGTFESKTTGLVNIYPGSVILLFPGVWHRYQPEAETGWIESWVELQGNAVKRLEAAGIISAKRPVYLFDAPSVLEAVLDQCHRVVEARPLGYAAVLGTLGLQLLAWLEGGGSTGRAGERSVEEAVRHAQETLAGRLDRPVNVEALASQYGLSYSTLRHTFKKLVGVSPKQYHLQLRLRKASDLLQNTDLSLADIADALGFASPFHLSQSFKSHMGMPPSTWRKRQERRTIN